eukprot:3795123-Prymnesium_polylepis.1
MERGSESQERPVAHVTGGKRSLSKDFLDEDDEDDDELLTDSRLAELGGDPTLHRKVRHNLAERRRTNRINKLFNQLHDLLSSPDIAPLCVKWDGKGEPPKTGKPPRRSKAAVLEAAIVCIENLQRAVALLDHQAMHNGGHAIRPQDAGSCLARLIGPIGTAAGML